MSPIATMTTAAALKNLELRWQADSEDFDVPEFIVDVLFKDIVEKFASPHRHYHTLAHLAEVFDTLDGLDDELIDRPRCHFATWYHDIIYVPGAADNEERSAQIAEKAMDALGVPEQLITNTARLIRATADHSATGDETDALFLDADSAILGADDDAYDAYTANVRAEYAALPAEAFNAGRKAFLEEWLARPRIFLTYEFETKLATQARSNMARELATLSSLSPPPLGGRAREGAKGKRKNIDKARTLRRNQTDAERLLWSALRRAQIEEVQFRRQQPIGPFIADFFCPAAKLVVELDGDPHTNDTVFTHDEKRTNWLKNSGYDVLRFWNSDVKTNIEGVVETIRKAVRNRLSPPPRPSPS